MYKKYRAFVSLAFAIAMFVPLVSGAQVAPLVNPSTPSPASAAAPLLCYDFNRSLKPGNKGEAVRMLQYFLISGEQATIDPNEYGVFGQTTMAAVTAFQQKYASDILSRLPHQQPNGTVGPITRAKFKALYGCQIQVSQTPAVVDYSGIQLGVSAISLDNIGVTATFCNKGTVSIPSAPFRIRLNGINRDFDIIGARTAGTCDTEAMPYITWGLSYDPAVTFTAIALIDPNNTYRKSTLQFPTNGTATLNSYAITGAHLSVRSIILKSTGVQATFCNLGSVTLTAFPVRLTANGMSKDFDIPGAYKPGQCSPMSWSYSVWGLTYTPGTVYTVNVQVDPNNSIQEVNEFDNSATIVGTP